MNVQNLIATVFLLDVMFHAHWLFPDHWITGDAGVEWDLEVRENPQDVIQGIRSMDCSHGLSIVHLEKNSGLR